MATPRVSIITRLILENKGEILLLAQTNQNGGKFSLPGGKVEPNESPIEALVRECREEADINIKVENLRLVHVLHRQKAEEAHVVMYFKTIRWHGNLISKEPKKFKKVEWFPLDNLPKKMSKITRSVLDKFHKGVLYSEVVSNKVITDIETN